MPNPLSSLFQLPFNDYVEHVKTRMSYEEIRLLASFESDNESPAHSQQYIDVARSEALQKLLQWCIDHALHVSLLTKLKQDCVGLPWAQQETMIKSMIQGSHHLVEAILMDFLAQVGHLAARPLLQKRFLIYTDLQAHRQEELRLISSARLGRPCPRATLDNPLNSTATAAFSLFSIWSRNVLDISLLEITSSIEKLAVGEMDPIFNSMELALSGVDGVQLSNDPLFMGSINALLRACQLPKSEEQKNLFEKQVFALFHIISRLGIFHPFYSEAAFVFCEKSKDNALPPYQRRLFYLVLTYIVRDYLDHEKRARPTDWAVMLMKELLILDTANRTFLRDHEIVISYFLKNSDAEASWFWDILKEKISALTYKELNLDETLTFLNCLSSNVTKQPFFIDLIRSTFKILFDIQHQYALGEIPEEKYTNAPGHILACISHAPEALYQEDWFQEGFFESLHSGFITFDYKFSSSLGKLFERIPLNLLNNKRLLTFIDSIVGLIDPVCYPNLSSRRLSRYIEVLLSLFFRQDINESVVYHAPEYNKNNIINHIRTRIQADPKEYNSVLRRLLTSLEPEWIQLALDVKPVPSDSSFQFMAAQQVRLPECGVLGNRTLGM